MAVFRASFSGSPNVGLFGYATDSYALLGELPDEKRLAEIGKTLGSIPIHRVTVAGTGMPGVFLAGNSRAVLGPAIMFEHEAAALRRLGVPLKLLETVHTCLGNTIACNDKGAVVSPAFSEGERQAISDALGVPVTASTVAGLDTPGAFIVLNGPHGIVHRDVQGEEKALIERTLHVTLEPATVNLGTPYVHAAIINNRNGFIIGEQSGGPEIVHIDEALGYE